MRETIWRHQLYDDERFEPLTNSGKKSYLSLYAKSIKIIFVNLRNKLTQGQLAKILIYV